MINETLTPGEMSAGGLSLNEIVDITGLSIGKVKYRVRAEGVASLTKKKIHNLIQLRYKIAQRALESMEEHSNQALGRQFGYTSNTISKISGGSMGIADKEAEQEIKRRAAIRKRAEKVYGRHGKTKMIQQFGKHAVSRSIGGKEKKKPVRLEWLNTGAGQFLTMQLTSNPCELARYY